MNMKKKNVLNKVKILTLAGLMGMASCKDNNAPDDPIAPTPDNNNNTFVPPTEWVEKDEFLTHLSNVDAASFYEIGETDQTLRFSTDYNTGKVEKFSALFADDGNDMLYPFEAARKSPRSNKSVGMFKSEAYRSFNVENGGYNWTIDNVSNDVYNSTYKNMSLTELATFAKNRILQATNNQDVSRATAIYDGIVNGMGSWEQGPETSITVISEGHLSGLKHTDCGHVHLYQVSDNFRFPYAGGVASRIVNSYAPAEQAVYRGRAYGTVNIQKNSDTYRLALLSTDSAVLTITPDAETLVLPFKDWYRVTIVFSSGTNKSEFIAEQADKTVDSEMALMYPEVKDFDMHQETQSNGLSVFVGDQTNIRTKYASIKYGDDATNPTEAVVLGGREDIKPAEGSTNGVFFTYAFAGLKQNQK